MPTSYPLAKIKVVLLENIHPIAERAFRDAGYTVEAHNRAWQGQELIDIAADASIIGIRSKTRLTADYFQAARRLWAVGCYCIGTNQVDLVAAAARGVPVFNAPYQNTRSVAELVIAEIVALHRRLVDKSAAMHRGAWDKSAEGAHEIRGRTLGIVGYGRIGSQVSVLAEAMGMKVLYHDVIDVLPLGNAQRAASLADLLERSDVVTLHVPATPATRGMIDADCIARMKPRAHLINNARGDVVDLDALAAALRDERLAGAAIDVFPQEPEANRDVFDSPLRGVTNVILTPHIGGSTIEAQESIAHSASARLIKLIDNGTTDTAVNVPEVALPRLHKGKNDLRLVYWHHNRAGALKQLNSVIADLGLNIEAQYSRSRDAIAYAITDFTGRDEDTAQALKARVLAIPETLRARLIYHRDDA
ncbi:MAG: phosphoglycerate dehydrogenase [Myxococcales bacterium]|nr:phosphoglycerate dehydrogenase [Myxococcales bacterium]